MTGGGFGLDTAKEQAVCLLAAAEASPVRQLSYELRRRAIEWQRAFKDLEVCEDGEAVIELAGSLTPGMRVLAPGHRLDAGDEWRPLVRVILREGQVSLHVQDPMGRADYVNLASTASPVVVRS